MRKAVRGGLTALLVLGLLASTFVLEASLSNFGDGGARETTTVSYPPGPAVIYGGLRVTVVALNDSSQVSSHLPISIRRSEIVTDDRLLLYAAQGGPVEVELPADAYYLIAVEVPLSPVAIRVRVLGSELTNLKIWINQVTRRASSFEVQDVDSTGRVAEWGSIFVRTDKIATPQNAWNTTMVLLKSDLLPAAPYSDARLVQAEQVGVSVIGAETAGSSVYLQLRSASVLRTTGISGLSFLGFASGYQVSYSAGWTNSGNILRELIRDGPPPTGG